MWFWLQLLSLLAWGWVNVLDSVLVHHYDRRPYVLQWHQSFYTLSFIALLAVTQPIRSAWALPLFLSGIVAYAGDWVFFRALHRIDTSVTNIAWGMLDVMLIIAGMILFGEAWSLWQGAGVALLFCGVALLSLWGKHLDGRGFVLLLLLATLYFPFYLAQKSAIVAGESVLVAFFWPLLGREILAGAMPFMVPSWRREVMHVFRSQTAAFPLLNGTVVILFFAGTFLTASAFARGPLSLVAAVGNAQPFVVLLFAWVLWTQFRERAARELLTAQAVGVKIISFLIVFAGLALLAFHQ